MPGSTAWTAGVVRMMTRGRRERELHDMSSSEKMGERRTVGGKQKEEEDPVEGVGKVLSKEPSGSSRPSEIPSVFSSPPRIL